MQKSALVIGAGGAIAKAVIEQLAQRYAQVFAISRSEPELKLDRVSYYQFDTTDEEQVQNWCEHIRGQTQLEVAICCIGILHGELDSHQVMPEKRLEDICAQQLAQYFSVNSIIPALWLKHLAKLMKANEPAYLAFVSARVGSISDNHLGGWYGYRASKAALNMLIKSAQVELQRRAKNIVLVSYHPGTVDSLLSKPFQANVPAEKLFTPEFTAKQLLSHLPGLSAETGPHYIDWQGKPISW